MPPYEDGENNFSDDDLDDLPLNALAELEHNAIQSTQATYANSQSLVQPPARLNHTAAPSSDYGDDFADEDLDDAVVIDESRSTPAIIQSFAQHASRPPTRQHVLMSKHGASQHGSNASLNNRSIPNVPHFQPSIRTATQPMSQRGLPPGFSQGSQPLLGLDNHAELLRRLEELQQKNKILEQNLNAKSGEVAIVRGKHEKESKEHERELNAVRKVAEDKLSKQKKELDTARIAASNAATERDFIKQDLAESARVGRLRVGDRKEPNTTPKKKKSLPHRDGFDDDEIENLSPSKVSSSKSRSRVATPSKSGKRKRKVFDSPVTALDLQFNHALEEPPQSKLFIMDETIIAKLGIQDDRFDFIGTMLDHRPSNAHLRTVEALGKHSLPSSNEESLAAVILGKIPSLGPRKQITDLPVEFCELLISLWASCLKEKYYHALYLLVDWLAFALELKTTAIAPHILDSLLPLLQTTVDIVVIPRFYRRPLEGYDEVIDVASYLNVLHMTALGCMSDLEHITRFWRFMRLDFVLLCLSQNQPTEHFHQMLKVLSTSILHDTFGNIDPSKQSLDAVYIIDRLTYPLFQIPFQPTVDIRLEPDILLPLRLGCLHLLTSMTRSPFASAALAQHQTTLGRLICLMSDTLDNLYDWHAAHELSGLILTHATRLLYHLVTKHPNINMQQKLTHIHGGPQKYLLVLARLNFSDDDLVLEKGIAPDVQGLALEMLESAVTPEEGDKIFEAFLGS